MPYQIPITGRLVDSFGSGISGASVFFTSKATSRGVENVAKTASAYFTADASGYYSASVASGWYKIFYQEPANLEPVQIGVATVSGYGATDLGTLIDNSIPPPTHLDLISNLNTTGKVNGSPLLWNAVTRKWEAGIPIEFETLPEIDVTGKVDGSALVYNATSQLWEAAPHRSAGPLYHIAADSGNAGGSLVNLHTYTLPANTLSRDLDALRITATFTTTGRYENSGGEKRIQTYFGNTLLSDFQLMNAYNNYARPVNCFAQTYFTRKSAVLQFATSTATHDEFSSGPFWREPLATGVSLNLAAAQTLRFVASGLTPNSIVQREFTVEFLPAP